MRPVETQLLTFREPRRARELSASYRRTTMSMFVLTAGTWLGGGTIILSALLDWLADPSALPGAADIPAVWMIAAGTITLLMANERRRSTRIARSTEHRGRPR